MGTSIKNGLLEDLQEAIRSECKGVMASLCVSSSGLPFLNTWQLPTLSEHSLTYLPLFYVVCVETEGQIKMKLITFHGKAVDELKTSKIEDQLSFVKKLQDTKLCSGIDAFDGDLQLDLETFANVYLVEQFESRVIVRSRRCHFAIHIGQTCSACQELTKTEIKEPDVKVEPEEEPMSAKRRKLRKNETCFICGDVVKGSLKLLRRHIWLNHLKLKPYKCKHCDFLSTSKTFVFRHHFQNVHGFGQSGSVDDVEAVLDSVQAIEEFENKHGLQLGPSLLEEEEDFTEDKPKELGSFKPSKRSFKECSICLGQFSSEVDLEQDMAKHAESLDLDGTAKCPTCLLDVAKLEMNHHFATEHKDMNAGCCLYCMSVVFRKKLRLHISQTHCLKRALCPKCGKSVSASAMKEHLDGVHGDAANKVMCPSCGKKFANQSRLSSHVRKIHDRKEKFKCKFCGQLIKDKHTLRAHYVCVHLKAYPYKCKFCKYVAPQRQRVYEHCRSVHKSFGGRQDVEEVESELQRIREFERQQGLDRKSVPSTTGFKCWLCSDYFISNSSLMKHELGHLELWPYQCQDCSTRFNMKALVVTHCKQVHGKRVDIKKVVGDKDKLELHQKVRKIPRQRIEKFKKFVAMKPTVIPSIKGLSCNPYGCTECRDSFANLAEFYYHFDQIHSDLVQPEDCQPNAEEKKLTSCQSCGFQANDPQILQRHIEQLHLKESPVAKVEYTPKITKPRKYRCRHCHTYTAVKKFTVHRHIKNHHGAQETFESDVLLIPEAEQLELHKQLIMSRQLEEQSTPCIEDNFCAAKSF